MSQPQLLATPTPSRGIRVTLVADPEQRERLVQAVRDLGAARVQALRAIPWGEDSGQEYDPHKPLPVGPEMDAYNLACERLDDAKDHLRVHDEAERLRKRFEKEGRP